MIAEIFDWIAVLLIDSLTMRKRRWRYP